AGRCSTSPTMFFMNTDEPAPIKVILGLATAISSKARRAAGAELEQILALAPRETMRNSRHFFRFSKNSACHGRGRNHPPRAPADAAPGSCFLRLRQGIRPFWHSLLHAPAHAGAA